MWSVSPGDTATVRLTSASRETLILRRVHAPLFPAAHRCRGTLEAFTDSVEGMRGADGSRRRPLKIAADGLGIRIKHFSRPDLDYTSTPLASLLILCYYNIDDHFGCPHPAHTSYHPVGITSVDVEAV